MLFSLLFSAPLFFLAICVALIISLTVHEFSHVLVAKLLGDDTGERAGRLTLNPLPHLDPWGLLAVLLIGFGWGRPAPFNPYNLRWPKSGPALVALGGPASNLLLIILFGVVLKIIYPLFGPLNYLTIFLQILVSVNVGLMIFNLIPISPLDGSHLLRALLKNRWPRLSIYLDLYGPRLLLGLILISLLFNVSIFGYLIYPILRLVGRALNLPLIF